MTVTWEVPRHQHCTLVPRCSSPWAHSVCMDIIISIVQEQWCLTPSKPSRPCTNNGNAKLQLCMQWITRPEGTMSERKWQWGAIDRLNQHLLFISATWFGLTGNKSVQEVTGQCVMFVAGYRSHQKLDSWREWIVWDDWFFKLEALVEEMGLADTEHTAESVSAVSSVWSIAL